MFLFLSDFNFSENCWKRAFLLLETVQKQLKFLKNRQNRPHLAGFFDRNTNLTVFRRIIHTEALRCTTIKKNVKKNLFRGLVYTDLAD